MLLLRFFANDVSYLRWNHELSTVKHVLESYWCARAFGSGYSRGRKQSTAARAELRIAHLVLERWRKLSLRQVRVAECAEYFVRQVAGFAVYEEHPW